MFDATGCVRISIDRRRVGEKSRLNKKQKDNSIEWNFFFLLFGNTSVACSGKSRVTTKN